MAIVIRKHFEISIAVYLKLHWFNKGMPIGRASLARENEAGGSWGQEVHILHVNI